MKLKSTVVGKAEAFHCSSLLWLSKVYSRAIRRIQQVPLLSADSLTAARNWYEAEHERHN